MARARRGFTLIEALIAFAIMALALSAFLGAFGEGLSGEQRAASAASLALEARSLADEVGASIALEPGDYAGDLESGTRWEVSIAEAWPQAFADLDRGGAHPAVAAHERFFATHELLSQALDEIPVATPGHHGLFVVKTDIGGHQPSEALRRHDFGLFFFCGRDFIDLDGGIRLLDDRLRYGFDLSGGSRRGRRRRRHGLRRHAGT